MANGGDWEDLVEAIGRAGKVVLDDPRVQSPVEGVRYLTRLVASGALVELENQDPAYPHFARYLHPWQQWGLPNPDYAYLLAPVHGDFSYRIFGRRGTGHMLIFEVYDLRWAKVPQMRVGDCATHVIDGSGDLSIGADGQFEITVSREKRDGNWLELPEGEAMVMVRNAFYDWDTEDPAEVLIEREGATYPPSPYTDDDLRQRVGRLAEFLREVPTFMARGVDQAYAADPHTLVPLRFGGDQELRLQDQHYLQGVCRCGAGEAIILEVTPPSAKYWSFHLATTNWESFDWDMRQTSLNGHQAVLDADGVFRAVISHEDPGVPNWLDASSHTTALIVGRYYRADSVPIPRLTTVAIEEVREHLPPDTAVVSPGERSANLRRRMLSVRRLLGF